MSDRKAIGVDLGGTKMLVGVLGEGAEVLYRDRTHSAGLDSEALLDAIEAQLRAAVESHPEVASIGLGVPCTIDRASGTCVQAVNLPLRDVPLRDRIADRLGLPTSLDNDANTAALAEHRHGSAKGTGTSVTLTIGTGIGGGLIIDGRPFRGATGAGAELGHLVVESDGPPCQGNCPNHGCVETMSSGTALAREGRRVADEKPDSRLAAALAGDGEIDGKAVVDLAIDGDEDSCEILRTAGTYLGVALSSLANVFEPEVIVIGGGVAAAGDLLLEPAIEEMRRRALEPMRDVGVELAALGNEAGMIGAATLGREEAGALGGAQS